VAHSGHWGWTDRLVGGRDLARGSFCEPCGRARGVEGGWLSGFLDDTEMGKGERSGARHKAY
jgi:hypothetical protein